MRTLTVIGCMAALLIALAIFLPSNTLTGHVVQDETCKGIGCVELCDIDAPVCGEGLTCCATHWESGVCDYGMNCEQIREYSLFQSIETYQDSVRQQPSPVHADFKRFFLPLLIVVGIVIYFVSRRNDPIARGGR